MTEILAIASLLALLFARVACRPADIRRPSGFHPPASRKEVIQPQVPLRLPCYDFTPVADLTVVG